MMYNFFKKRGEHSAKQSYLPAHIGIIMDGNGRWASKRGLPVGAGHRAGSSALERIVKHCNKIGIQCVTAYAFSTENWERPQKEIDDIMALLIEYLSQAENKLANENIKICVIGDRTGLGTDIQASILHAEKVSEHNTGTKLNIAINYGGRAEIVSIARRAALDVLNGTLSAYNIDESLLDSYTYTHEDPDVDLIIRPSGELRLSNFLIWQAAYAELWFSRILWPDFSPKDLDSAIADFQKRNRRFGARLP